MSQSAIITAFHIGIPCAFCTSKVVLFFTLTTKAKLFKTSTLIHGYPTSIPNICFCRLGISKGVLK